MTKPRYRLRCAAGSKASGLAASTPVAGNPDYAWGVNFNNGNSNNWHRDNNNGFVRAVRSVSPSPGEFQGAAGVVSLREIYDAWRRARRGKKPSCNRLRFEARWIDRLPQLQRRLQTRTWSPAPSACFIAQRPKAREIHAPDFADRVVHHWLVPQLERACDGGFIFDSWSNRKGKGTHGAVLRLQRLLRQVQSGQGGGWYMQLDIRSFFNTIHRPTLWAQLKRLMQKHGLPAVAQHAAHALLCRAPTAAGVRYYGTRAQRERVPPHKRLAAAAPGCGLPIGNLSSQFFANVYLDALDQFVKHQLRVRRYIRYVDDLVLVHENREQLLAWLPRIQTFLHEQLRLELKPEIKLKPIQAGCDFLGYIAYPTHLAPRRRVLHHAREALEGWERAHVRAGAIHATPEAIRGARSLWGSYEGHLRHARAWRAREELLAIFPWLRAVTAPRRIDYRLEGSPITIRLESP